MISKEKIEKAWELINSKHIETNDEIQIVRYAVRIARELSERDTPEMAIKETVSLYVNEEYYYKIDYYNCPSCEKVVLYDRWQDITLHTTSKHCQHCGQRLDWGDDK